MLNASWLVPYCINVSTISIDRFHCDTNLCRKPHCEAGCPYIVPKSIPIHQTHPPHDRRGRPVSTRKWSRIVCKCLVNLLHPPQSSISRTEVTWWSNQVSCVSISSSLEPRSLAWVWQQDSSVDLHSLKDSLTGRLSTLLVQWLRSFSKSLQQWMEMSSSMCLKWCWYISQ